MLVQQDSIGKPSMATIHSVQQVSLNVRASFRSLFFSYMTLSASSTTNLHGNIQQYDKDGLLSGTDFSMI